MIRRLTPYLLVVLSLAGGLFALSIRPATAETRRSADYVVVVGIPGLRWEDVSESGTPNLWRLAEHGSIGSLSVRSALKPTCPVDGPSAPATTPAGSGPPRSPAPARR
jgi:hypothetical protein